MAKSNQSAVGAVGEEAEGPMVSICVASVRADFLPHLVESIVNQTTPTWELIVAAQGESERLYSYLDTVTCDHPQITYIRLDRMGRSLALNAAAAKARAPILAFTDDDCTVDPEWVEILVDSFRRMPTIGLVAGDCIAPPRPRLRLTSCPATRTIECIYRPKEDGFRAPSGFYFGGGNFAVRRETFDSVGPFDEYLGPGAPFPAAEDTDFGLRAEMLGVPMWTRPDLRVYHTFGRRYGLRAVLRHYRAYAIGSGALGAKLKLWDHRLWYEWNRPRRPREAIIGWLTRPTNEVRRLYQRHYANTGETLYLRDFEVGQDKVTRPKAASERGLGVRG